MPRVFFLKLAIRCLCVVMTTLFLIAVVRAADFPLDLRASANRGFYDSVAGDGQGGWSDQGPSNSIRKIPLGRWNWQGMAFDVIDPATNDGRSILAFDSMNSATGLRSATLSVNPPSSASVLYLMHTACWAGQAHKNRPIGRLIVEYADQQPSKSIDVVIGRDIYDWWRPSDCANALVAHEEQNGSANVGIYVSRFTISDGQARPVRISFRPERSGESFWIVIAATLSDDARTNVFDAQPTTYPAITEGFKAFDQSDIQVKPGTALDFTFLSDAPAGKYGFVRIGRDGHYVFEHRPDRSQRFLCINWNMPHLEWLLKNQADIEAFADQAVRAGYNAFRPHGLDSYLMHTQNNGQVAGWNPQRMDWFDRLAAALQQRGIYMVLELSTTNCMYLPVYPWGPEGSPKHVMKMRVNFDPQAMNVWQTGVKKLLEHVNPYLGLAYKDNPQVISVNFRNEPSIGVELYGNVLKNDTRAADLIKPVMDSWRRWLKEKYQTTDRLRQAWTTTDSQGKTLCHLKSDETLETVGLPPQYGRDVHVRDLQRFYDDVDRKTSLAMQAYVRQLGVGVPMSDFNMETHADTAIVRDTLPMVENHMYHDHPSGGGQDDSGVMIHNRSSLADGARYVQQIGATRFLGRPFTVTEWNHAYWNQWRYEAGMVFPSYAALQGWDLIAHYGHNIALKVNEPAYKGQGMNFFSIIRDPVMKTADRMAVMFYLRGDVTESSRPVELNITTDDIFKTLEPRAHWPDWMIQPMLLAKTGLCLQGWPDSAAKAPYQPHLVLSLKDQNQSLGKKSAPQTSQLHQATWMVKRLREQHILPPDNVTDPAKGLWQSDTGEILLDSSRRHLRVITPYSQAVALSPEVLQADLPAFSVTSLRAEGAGVFLGALDHHPIQESSRLLLIVATHAINTDMQFKDRRRLVMDKIGRFPALVRTEHLKLQIRHHHPDRLKMWALASDGTRRDAIALQISEDGVHLELDTSKLQVGPTPYFEISAE